MSNESIKSRKYYRVHNGESWDRMHFVTDANSVDANDGDTMETKVGAIKGITTSTEVTEEGYAADATVVAALNSSLGGLRFGYDGDSNAYGYYGADDSFIPFKSGDFCHETAVNSGSTTSKIAATLSHTVQSKGKISITQIAYFSATNGDNAKIFTITKNGESITPNELYQRFNFSIYNTEVDCELNDILEITSAVKSTSGSYAKLGYIEINMIK